MREIKLESYEWCSDIADGYLTFTVNGEAKTLSGGFYKENRIEWMGDNQKGEKFVDWKLDPHARDHLKRGYNFLLSYEEIDYLEGMFNRKMNELGL